MTDMLEMIPFTTARPFEADIPSITILLDEASVGVKITGLNIGHPHPPQAVHKIY